MGGSPCVADFVTGCFDTLYMRMRPVIGEHADQIHTQPSVNMLIKHIHSPK